MANVPGVLGMVSIILIFMYYLGLWNNSSRVVIITPILHINLRLKELNSPKITKL